MQKKSALFAIKNNNEAIYSFSDMVHQISRYLHMDHQIRHHQLMALQVLQYLQLQCTGPRLPLRHLHLHHLQLMVHQHQSTGLLHHTYKYFMEYHMLWEVFGINLNLNLTSLHWAKFCLSS